MSGGRASPDFGSLALNVTTVWLLQSSPFGTTSGSLFGGPQVECDSRWREVLLLGMDLQLVLQRLGTRAKAVSLGRFIEAPQAALHGSAVEAGLTFLAF